MLSQPCKSRLALATKPILHRTVPSRPLHRSAVLSSQMGRTPISIPPEVDFKVIPVPPSATQGRSSSGESMPVVRIKGPLGELSLEIPKYVTIEHNEASRKATVGVLDRTVRKQREMWGTTRAYLQNHVMGVSEGHTTILRLVGVGYRATIEKAAITVSPEFEGQQFVSLKVGYSHPIELHVPRGVKASTPQPTRIMLEGSDKEVVKSFAARIRKWRVPEPYKGKGIFVDDETIRLKAKKIK